jgi:hypothetical protein
VLGTNSKNKNIREFYRGINEFNKGYQLRSNLVKDENGDMLAYPYNIMNRWKNYFCQLLNVHGVNDVGQTEINTAEPSFIEAEIAIEKFKRYNHKVLIKFWLHYPSRRLYIAF